MSDAAEWIVVPLLMVVGVGLVLSIWIGGNSGDISWIGPAISALVPPAIFVGVLIASGVAVLNAI